MTSVTRASAPGADDQHFYHDLQKLVEQTGIAKGRITITVHEGSASKAEIQPQVMIKLDCPECPDSSERDVTIRLDAVPAFVRSRLEHVIRRKIGRFGFLEVEVENRCVEQWGFFARCKRK